MTSQSGSSRRSMSLPTKSSSLLGKKRTADKEGSMSASRSMGLAGERTVKNLRLSKALTVPETTSVYEACIKMATRGVDAVLLTDSNALLSGILTDKDIATKVIAKEVNLKETPVSKVMTRNPIFVLSDTLAVEALQKMVQGRFRHLPIVENGEVIALLDIAKCLYDAIGRMERASEKEKAIAAAVEGVEKQLGTSICCPSTFIETLRERMFKPSLSTILNENSKVVRVAPTDTVLMATKKMLELRLSSVVVIAENKTIGILTSKDIMMRVIAKDSPPDSTTVEKVMTPNPECATIDTPIVVALHTMHEGKFLHLPVIDREGNIVAVVDVIHITHAAVATIGSTAGVTNETASSMMQKFWDSAMGLGPVDDDEETRSNLSEGSFKLASEGGIETVKSLPCSMSDASTTFSYKFKDKKGRMHRLTCDTQSLTGLTASILKRVGGDYDSNNLPQVMYEDEEHDKVVLLEDNDLAAAVDLAKILGWKVLRLHLDYSEASNQRREPESHESKYGHSDTWDSIYITIAAGATLIACLGVFTYVKRTGN